MHTIHTHTHTHYFAATMHDKEVLINLSNLISFSNGDPYLSSTLNTTTIYNFCKSYSSEAREKQQRDVHDVVTETRSPDQREWAGKVQKEPFVKETVLETGHEGSLGFELSTEERWGHPENWKGMKVVRNLAGQQEMASTTQSKRGYPEERDRSGSPLHTSLPVRQLTEEKWKQKDFFKKL